MEISYVQFIHWLNNINLVCGRKWIQVACLPLFHLKETNKGIWIQSQTTEVSMIVYTQYYKTLLYQSTAGHTIIKDTIISGKNQQIQ